MHIHYIHIHCIYIYIYVPMYRWSHVGARQHDLPCKSVEWLLHGVAFIERWFWRDNYLLLLFSI